MSGILLDYFDCFTDGVDMTTHCVALNNLLYAGLLLFAKDKNLCYQGRNLFNKTSPIVDNNNKKIVKRNKSLFYFKRNKYEIYVTV